MFDLRGSIIITFTITRGQITMHVNAVASSLFATYCVVDAIDDDNFGTCLESFIQISLTSIIRMPAVICDN